LVNPKRFAWRSFFPGGRMPPSTAGKDACRYIFRPALAVAAAKPERCSWINHETHQTHEKRDEMNHASCGLRAPNGERSLRRGLWPVRSGRVHLGIVLNW
jgi:hypothetical protein